jgi:hypothetical protein
MKTLILVSFAANMIAANDGQTTSKPTYTRHIAPILHHRCVECHRKGEVAPMAFTNYREVRPWARAIKDRVLTRTMPPWLADPKHGQFENDRKLSQKEVDLIAAWVEAGAPEGDARDLQTFARFEDGWAIGKPDVVLQLEQEVDVPATGVIPYQYYTISTNFTEDKWIEASEIRPGNRSVVHHVIAYIQDPSMKDDVKPGAAGREKLSGYAPGEQPKIYPPGVAKHIKAGSKLVFQMHYTTNGKAAKDRSYIGLKFASAPVKQLAKTGMAINTSFVIPAGSDSHEVRSTWTAPDDVRIVDLMPHMHVRGKDFVYTAVYPDGRQEVLLSVPRYDFNWQLLYRPKDGVLLPKGTKLECVAHFDNSPNNKWNPDPTKDVKWGPQTWEEMMIGWFDYVVEKENLLALK